MGFFLFRVPPHLKYKTQVFQLLLIQLPHHFLRSIHCERGTRRAPWPEFPLEPRAGGLSDSYAIIAFFISISSSPSFGVFFLNVGHSARDACFCLRLYLVSLFFFFSIFIFNSFSCYLLLGVFSCINWT